MTDLGITVLRQGSADRAQLLDEFRRDTDSVLFATDSFWEGVDTPGDALEVVIICRLPFRVPNDPIFEARVDAIRARGGDAFAELSLPEAAMRLKQGFGRLMRRATDRGIVVVLDPRIATKYYGKVFLDSLPPARRCVKSMESVMYEIENFLYA